MRIFVPIAKDMDIDHTASGNEAVGMKSSQVGNNDSVVDLSSSGVFILYIYYMNPMRVIFTGF